MRQKEILWARKCDATGEGMNKGFCVDDGMAYFKYDKDMVKYLRDYEKDFKIDPNKNKTDEEILEEYYQSDYYYWTEWEDEEEYQYKEINGKLIEL